MQCINLCVFVTDDELKNCPAYEGLCSIRRLCPEQCNLYTFIRNGERFIVYFTQFYPIAQWTYISIRMYIHPSQLISWIII